MYAPYFVYFLLLKEGKIDHLIITKGTTTRIKNISQAVGKEREKINKFKQCGLIPPSSGQRSSNWSRRCSSFSLGSSWFLLLLLLMLPWDCLGHEVVEGKQEEKKEKGVPTLSEHSECSFLFPESEIEGFSLSPACATQDPVLHWPEILEENNQVSGALHFGLLPQSAWYLITFQSPLQPFHAVCMFFCSRSKPVKSVS